MIARHETHIDKNDIWSALSAPLPADVISWRQDGRPIARDGRYLARFVAYIEANTVRERLDSVVPGEWDKTLELLPPVTNLDEDANQGACSFKCRIQILGVIREDVGTGKDYKQAATDAFKRAAVRYGIGHELYDYGQNWVQMDGDGKYAKPIEDPAIAYARRYGRAKPAIASTATADAADGSEAQPAAPPSRDERAGPDGGTYSHTLPDGPDASASAAKAETCPKCGGRMWDNRLTKRNPKAPDFKCRDRACDGVIWPPRAERSAEPSRAQQSTEETEEIPF